MFDFLRKPTSLECALLMFSLIITYGTIKVKQIYEDKLTEAGKEFSQLEQKLIDKEEIIIKRQEGNDTVRYIVKPNTEKQILMFVPVDINPEPIKN